ncbi:DUF3592 domain-containing protein [Pseudoteredinibacter isoporae]|uniref:Na+-transporting methylmalonyl-CoA/oxaloacetate decarboxylase gamma subunit n=1 Tax=Pseudoteredinibacter isoporae TaxID=570281 RepID=A0A7X0JU41_9GAMM|nr:DUF3592 domain-containing protein [Pseudoteredinibacter isoporae]MBB6522279.1 Na+-transporting methylmalonyl-CoA/oxaloacetate decarboxylase gamma subunit [Pseudoteredinibacter isoporae]NHO87812.1 DUF3592 domain-containing protein [Pseudoteredinibacter isoporae]NIB23857.1 DUF3592 domain-containing protein [Pseudoteredinibacter isoporae]
MPIVKVIFISVSIIFIILSILPVLIYKILKKRTNTWPVVSAKVTYSKLLNQTDAQGESLIEAIVHFEYEFRGKAFTSQTPTLSSFNLFPSLDYQREIYNKYTKGEYYNARVSPISGELAYLEVAPLSIISAVLMPFWGLDIWPSCIYILILL